MRKRDSFLRSVEAQIEIAGQLLRSRGQSVIVKYHGQTRKCSQAFPAHAGSQVHSLQVDGNGPNRTDAIQAKFEPKLLRELFQCAHVVQHTRRRLAMDGPDPAYIAGRDPASYLSRIKDPAPVQPELVEA